MTRPWCWSHALIEGRFYGVVARPGDPLAEHQMCRHDHRAAEDAEECARIEAGRRNRHASAATRNRAGSRPPLAPPE